MNKKEAAEYLGVNPKTIERYVQRGELPANYKRGKTGNELVVEQADLDKLREELEAPRPVQARTDNHRQDSTDTTLARLPSNGHSSHLMPLDSADLLQVLTKAFSAAIDSQDRQRQAPTVAIDSKLMLTVDEASAFAGIGRSALETAIREGKLIAYRGYGRGRRIKRADLEQWVKEL